MTIKKAAGGTLENVFMLADIDVKSGKPAATASGEILKTGYSAGSPPRTASRSNDIATPLPTTNRLVMFKAYAPSIPVK